MYGQFCEIVNLKAKISKFVQIAKNLNTEKIHEI